MVEKKQRRNFSICYFRQFDQDYVQEDEWEVIETSGSVVTLTKNIVLIGIIFTLVINHRTLKGLAIIAPAIIFNLPLVDT